MSKRHAEPTAETLPDPEFSRKIPIERLRRGPLDEKISANAAECAALASRFDLESVGRLEASVALEPLERGMVRVSGTLDADVVQTCVVSLEPVPAKVSERFSALFVPAGMMEDEAPGPDLDIDALADDDEDLPEPIIDQRIDIGELVAQHLSLALDPYPRADGVEATDFREHEDPDFDAYDDPGSAEEPRQTPFAGLDKLMKKRT